MRERRRRERENEMNQGMRGTRERINQDSSKKKKKKKAAVNKDIMVVTYIFFTLFICLIGYYASFIFFDSEEVVRNPYNKRQELMSESVTRGKILGSQGEVLAESIESEDGETVTRNFPYKNVFCHVVGRFDKGKTGLESSQSFEMLTSNMNPLEKFVNEITGKRNAGDDVVTTLNVKLQQVAYDALGDSEGAVVVMEPSTGKVLALVSKPDYDPNTVEADWEQIVSGSNGSSVLVNRATQGLYAPGSTFKIVTALAYMRQNSNYENFSYDCEGSETFGEVKINCYNNKVHGNVDLVSAMAKSCNSAFATIGTQLDISKYRETANELLFNKTFDFPFSLKESSFVLDSSSDTGEITQTSIGQGKTLITPMHNALISAAIANDGVLMQPYLVDRIQSASGDIITQNEPTEFATLMTSKEASALEEMMAAVVDSGTATALNNDDYDVVGKTGSAEYDSGKSSHAWFVGYSKTTKNDLVVSIIVEGAGTGAEYAVPIAEKIFDEYYSNK